MALGRRTPLVNGAACPRRRRAGGCSHEGPAVPCAYVNHAGPAGWRGAHAVTTAVYWCARRGAHRRARHGGSTNEFSKIGAIASVASEATKPGMLALGQTRQ